MLIVQGDIKGKEVGYFNLGAVGKELVRAGLTFHLLTKYHNKDKLPIHSDFHTLDDWHTARSTECA